MVEIFCDTKVSVYETPGHNPSCLCFGVRDFFFTGDAFIPGIPTVTNLPGGNKQQAKDSLDRIQSLIHNNTICAGHA